MQPSQLKSSVRSLATNNSSSGDDKSGDKPAKAGGTEANKPADGTSRKPESDSVKMQKIETKGSELSS